jgi:REP element-mobilizing transposase RayT
MPENNSLHHRKSIRLRGYDYTQAGAYFITLVTYQRKCLLGEWVSEEIKPSILGNLVISEWKRIERRFLTVELDEWVIMPNHFHGIIVLSVNSRAKFTRDSRVMFTSDSRVDVYHQETAIKISL